MNRLRCFVWIVPVVLMLVVNATVVAVGQNNSSGSSTHGKVRAGRDMHHDTSAPLLSITPMPMEDYRPNRVSSAAARGRFESAGQSGRRESGTGQQRHGSHHDSGDE